MGYPLQTLTVLKGGYYGCFGV